MLRQDFSYGFIQKLCVFYLVIWTISPPMEIGTVYRIAALLCAAVWFVLWIIRENPVMLEKEQFYAILFLMLIITVVYIESRSLSTIIKQIAMFMLIICYIMSRYYYGRLDELGGMVPIIMILLIIWNYNTVQALVEDPTIARRLVRDDETIYEYLKQGVGGYGLIYPQVCVSPLILAWILKSFRNNKLYFAVGVVWTVSFVWFLALAGYSIAVFASAMGALLLLFYRGRSGVAAFLAAIAIFLAVMLSIMYVDSFREWLLEVFDGSAVEKKILDLVSTAETGETGESIQVRMDAYVSSVINIFKYPIIGSLWRNNGGGHSAFLDITSKYGLLGGYMFAKMIYSVPLHYKKRYNDRFIIATSNATLITLMFVTALDSMSYSFTCMVFIIAPLMFEDIIKWTGAEEE